MLPFLEPYILFCTNQVSNRYCCLEVPQAIGLDWFRFCLFPKRHPSCPSVCSLRGPAHSQPPEASVGASNYCLFFFCCFCCCWAMARFLVGTSAALNSTMLPLPSVMAGTLTSTRLTLKMLDGCDLGCVEEKETYSSRQRRQRREWWEWKVWTSSWLKKSWVIESWFGRSWNWGVGRRREKIRLNGETKEKKDLDWDAQHEEITDLGRKDTAICIARLDLQDAISPPYYVYRGYQVIVTRDNE